MTTKRLRRNGWALLGTVASDSKDGVEYEIKRSPDGIIGCACMGWAMRKHCHHLDAWRIDALAKSYVKSAEVTSEWLRQHAHIAVAGESFTVRRAISFGAF